MRIKLSLIVLAVVVMASSVAVADHHEHGPPMGAPEQMKKVADMEGEWTVAVKMRMSPDQEWSTSTATAVISPVLSGGAQKMEYMGSMMGMPFEGLQVLFYDRVEGRYESLWIDNMSARGSTMTGNFVDGNLVMTGEDVHDGVPYGMRSTTIRKSDSVVAWTMEMSMDGGDTWFVSMDTTYTRKSS